jgi:para-nitrobenzyl esterase
MLAAPEAASFFQRAILQSTYAPSMKPADALESSKMYLNILGVARNDVAALRAIASEDLIAAQTKHVEQTMSLGLARGIAPIVDGRVLPKHPVEALKAGAAAGKPIMIGTNLDEARLFGAALPGARDLDEAGLSTRLAGLVPGAAEEPARATAIARAYREARAARGQGVTPFELHMAIQTDRLFRYHSTLVADAQSTQARVYAYLFTWPSPLMDGILGSCHALEIPFMFGNFDGPLGGLAGAGDDANGLSAKMRASWLGFVRNGNPNHDGLPEWQPYTAATRQTMRLDRTCALESDPMSPERRAWEPCWAN